MKAKLVFIEQVGVCWEVRLKRFLVDIKLYTLWNEYELIFMIICLLWTLLIYYTHIRSKYFKYEIHLLCHAL